MKIITSQVPNSVSTDHPESQAVSCDLTDYVLVEVLEHFHYPAVTSCVPPPHVICLHARWLMDVQFIIIIVYNVEITNIMWSCCIKKIILYWHTHIISVISDMSWWILLLSRTNNDTSGDRGHGRFNVQNVILIPIKISLWFSVCNIYIITSIVCLKNTLYQALWYSR